MKRRTLRALSAAAGLSAVLGAFGGTAATAAPAPVTTTTTTAATVVAAPALRIGMSAPRSEWSTRVAEVGGIDARRIFGTLNDPDSALRLAASEIAAGRMPILSFRLPGDDWAGATAGTYDVALRALSARLDALPGKVFVTIHHEPASDGTPAAYAAMQRHVLPILSPPSNVDAGVVVNGWFWSAKARGLTDAEIAQWLPPSVLQLAEVVAADAYQGGTQARLGEDAGAKIRRMSAWADRVGVKRMGIGEYNGLDGAAIRSAGDAVLADPRFEFASVFNSSENNREGVNWVLSGSRITEFRATVATARARG